MRKNAKQSETPKQDAKKNPQVVIAPAQFEQAAFAIIGTAPLVIHAFSAKAQRQIHETQEAGEQAKKRKKRDPKDFGEAYQAARHISIEGWDGISAAAFRSAMISACRVVGFQMTRAKLSVFVVADGFDANDGTPLVRITKGNPKYSEMPVRNDNGGVDLRARPMWEPGWGATVTVRWDAEQFSAADVANLLERAGLQVGVGEGRPDSPNSNGMQWGTFRLRADGE